MQLFLYESVHSSDIDSELRAVWWWERTAELGRVVKTAMFAIYLLQETSRSTRM